MRRSAFVTALLIATASGAETMPTSKHLQKIMSKGDGSTPKTAYRVSNVREEYEIAKALDVKIISQSLVVQPKPFDVLKVEDPQGQTREIWFDIGSFYPEF